MQTLSDSDRKYLHDRIQAHLEALPAPKVKRPPETWVDAKGVAVYIRGTRNRAKGRLTRAEVLCMLDCRAGTMMTVAGHSYMLPFRPLPETVPDFFVVVQAGGSTGEFYVHAFATLKAAYSHINNASRAAYGCSDPIQVPGTTDVGTIQHVLDAIGDLI